MGAATARPMGLFVPAKSLDPILQGGSPQEERVARAREAQLPSPLVGMGRFEFPTWNMCLVWKSKFRVKILHLINIKRMPIIPITL